MDHEEVNAPGGQKMCLICLNVTTNFDTDLDVGESEKLLNSCNIHLPSTIVTGVSLKQCHQTEKDIPICKDCFGPARKIAHLGDKLTEYQKEMANSVVKFSMDILHRRRIGSVASNEPTESTVALEVSTVSAESFPNNLHGILPPTDSQLHDGENVITDVENSDFLDNDNGSEQSGLKNEVKSNNMSLEDLMKTVTLPFVRVQKMQYAIRGSIKSKEKFEIPGNAHPKEMKIVILDPYHSSNSSVKSNSSSSNLSVVKKENTKLSPGGMKKENKKGNTTKRLNCQFCCNEVLYKKSALEIHMRSHTKERPYKCSICEKGFVSASSLYFHNCTPSDDGWFQCSKCDSCFVTIQHMKRHEMSHAEEKSCKSFMHCRKLFCRPSDLDKDKYKRIRTGKKPYKCSFCPKTFCLKSSVQLHEEINHSVRFAKKRKTV